MKEWNIRDLMDALDAPDLPIREDDAVSGSRIKEAVMKKVTTKRTLRRGVALAAACAAVLALSVLALAGTGAIPGFALLDGLTQEEEAQFRSDHSLGRADSSVSADGRVQYYDISGNVIFEGTEEEAAAYERQLEALRRSELEASTELVCFDGMELTPKSVTETAVSAEGTIPDFLITNGHMVVFTQEDGSGWELEAGDTAALHFVSDAPCHAVFYLIGTDGEVLEEALDLGKMAEPQWETVIPADGSYYFAVMYTSASSDAFTGGTLTLR